LSHDDVLHRLALLKMPLGRLTLGERRAGHALAHAALAAWHRLEPGRRPTCALQGFGTLGRGAAATLLERGVTITSLADEHGCVHADRGLPIARMLAAPRATSASEAAGSGTWRGPREAVLTMPADVLVLAAREGALPPRSVARLRAPIVAVGANGGVEAAAAVALHDRGVIVVPDLVAGAGGSAAMDALFAPAAPPHPAQVLEHVALIARTLTVRVLERAHLGGSTPAAAAADLAGEARLAVTERPYGLRTLAADAPGERCEVVGEGGR
jgi:glutamate dehydrogenase (NAD(P)+)